MAFLVGCDVPTAQAPSGPAYLDPSKPIDQRVSDLLGRLTLEEKASQCNHMSDGIPRLDIPMWGGWNQGLHGCLVEEANNAFTRANCNGSHLGSGPRHSIADAM